MIIKMSALLIPSKDILEDEEGNFYVYKLVIDSNENYKSNKVMIQKESHIII